MTTTQELIERRRSPRRLLDVPLIVTGETSEKHPFSEETFTISVSAHGALMLLAAPVAIGQTIVIIKPANMEGMEARVLRLGAPHGGLSQVAVEFVQPVAEFWPESIPA